MFNLFKSTTPTQSTVKPVKSTIVNTPLPINQPVKPMSPVMSTPSSLASNIVKTPTVAPKPVTQPTQNLVGGNIPAQYMTPQLQAYLSGLSGTSSTIQAPQTPVASPYVNTNPQGVQLDINGEALLPGGTPLSINPLNLNGAIPSNKIGTLSTSDVLSTRNYLESLQKQIMDTLTLSPAALQAQADLKNVQQQQLEGRAQTEAEIDRLMTTANLTREQAAGFLTETNRRAQNAQTQLALQQSALSNVVSNDQAQRQASMDAFKLLYGMNQPQSIGGNLVNPITGEVVYSAPQEPGEGFSLSAGQTRYDAQGNVIAQAAGNGMYGPMEAYIPGSNPTVDAWANGVKSGQYKMSDVPDEYKSAVAQATGMIKQPVSDTSINAITLVDELLGRNVGAITGVPNVTAFIPGTEAQRTKNLYNQLKGLLSLENRTMLKGSGAISDYEFKVLEQASSALGRNLSDKDFITELTNLKNKLSQGSPSRTTAGGIDDSFFSPDNF